MIATFPFGFDLSIFVFFFSRANFGLGSYYDCCPCSYQAKIFIWYQFKSYLDVLKDSLINFGGICDNFFFPWSLYKFLSQNFVLVLCKKVNHISNPLHTYSKLIINSIIVIISEWFLKVLRAMSYIQQCHYFFS